MGHNPHPAKSDSPNVIRVKRDGWTFLTNHGHVLVCLAKDPEVLLRDVAVATGITERAVQQIVSDLERAGVIVRLKVGRRNRYIVRSDETFRHPLEAGVTIGDFVELVESRHETHHLVATAALAGGRARAGGSSTIEWAAPREVATLARQPVG
jgi:predicted transcriptional regulator